MAETRTRNARSRRTRQQLRDAVLALAEEMDFAAINVSDIVERAGLNRSTYYLHFPDKESLIEETLAMLLDELTASGRMLRAADDPKAARFHPNWEDSLFRRISERPGLYRRLLGDAGANSFGARLLRANEEAVLGIWTRVGLPERGDGVPLRARARYAAAGTHGVILQWLDSGMTEDPETISRWAWALGFSDQEIR